MLKEFIGGELLVALENAKRGICSVEFDRVTIVHHNDADGICAGSILSRTFSHLGFEPGMFCIERVHPAVVEKIHRREGELVIYTDLGGLAGEVIRDADAGRNLVLILDHHPARRVEGERIVVADPELFGVSGDVFISASTLAYLFCRYLIASGIDSCPPLNNTEAKHLRVEEEIDRELAGIAVIGSVGDYHDRSGGILGYDRYALERAVSTGAAKIRIQDSRERYFLSRYGEFADVIADVLTTLGSVGYYSGDFRLAVRVALEGASEEGIRRAEELRRMKEQKFREKVLELRDGGFKTERFVQWFHVHRDFAPMGVKVIGLFCHTIKDMSFVDDSKFVAGFQDFIPELPGIGRVDWEGVKVSFRAPAPLEKRVLDGEVPGLDVTLPAATERLGGSADASHRIAAASMIEKGREEELIRTWEAVMEEMMGEGGRR